MSKTIQITKDFGSYVNTKCFDKYLDGKEDGVYEPYSEDGIVDLFIEFTKKQQKTNLKTEHYVREWIDEWVEIFPKGIKSGGKPIRSNAKDCLPKMVSFIKQYKYDRDLIFYATREYIKQQSFKNYDFTRCAMYFIAKQGEGSDLATWCEQCKDADLTKEHQTLEIVEHQGVYNEFI
jgi:hypothetical protein